MAATILSDLDGLLKRYYSPDIIAQQQFDADFLKTMPKAAERPGGESGAVYVGVNLARRQNGGAQNQNEEFRTNETGTKKQATIAAKINIWAIELTNFAINLSKSTDYAFMAGLDYEMQDALTAMKKDENRQAFGYGFGVLALTNGASAASTTVTVDTPGVQYFYPGMRIDIWTALSSGTKEVSNGLISSISESGLTLTMSAAVTCSNNAFIVRSGLLDSNPTDGKEMMGLQGIADDNTLFTTFQGLSRATYDIWNGTIVDASSAALTTDMVQRLADKVERRSGKVVDRLVSHRNQRRQYLALTVPQKRFMDDKMDLGFQVLEWNGIKWLVSHDCQRNAVYAYDSKCVELFESHPLKLDDSNGSTLTRIPHTDTVEAYYKHYAQIGSKHPAAVGCLESLATVTDY